MFFSLNTQTSNRNFLTCFTKSLLKDYKLLAFVPPQASEKKTTTTKKIYFVYSLRLFFFCFCPIDFVSFTKWLFCPPPTHFIPLLLLKHFPVFHFTNSCCQPLTHKHLHRVSNKEVKKNKTEKKKHLQTQQKCTNTQRHINAYSTVQYEYKLMHNTETT